jgi:hypothetical protein
METDKQAGGDPRGGRKGGSKARQSGSTTWEEKVHKGDAICQVGRASKGLLAALVIPVVLIIWLLSLALAAALAAAPPAATAAALAPLAGARRLLLRLLLFIFVLL